MRQIKAVRAVSEVLVLTRVWTVVLAGAMRLRRISGSLPLGAEAHVDFVALAARLKPRPFKAWVCRFAP